MLTALAQPSMYTSTERVYAMRRQSTEASRAPAKRSMRYLLVIKAAVQPPVMQTKDSDMNSDGTGGVPYTRQGASRVKIILKEHINTMAKFRIKNTANDDIIDEKSLAEEIKIALSDYFVADIVANGNVLFMTFDNGQKFRMTVDTADRFKGTI